jgi:hypothetical protein
MPRDAVRAVITAFTPYRIGASAHRGRSANEYSAPATRRFVRRDASADIWCCPFGGTTIENFWTGSRRFTKIISLERGTHSPSDGT